MLNHHCFLEKLFQPFAINRKFIIILSRLQYFTKQLIDNTVSPENNKRFAHKKGEENQEKQMIKMLLLTRRGCVKCERTFPRVGVENAETGSEIGSGISWLEAPKTLFLLTGVKPLSRRWIQIAGYFCPTTEEVAGESQDPASPPKIKPPSFLQLQTRAERSPDRRMDSYRALCLQNRGFKHI